MTYNNTSGERSTEERKFLHDLSSILASAVLHAGMMKESGDAKDVDLLIQAHTDLENLIKSRREFLKTAS